MFCYEHNLTDFEISKEVLLWLEDELLHYSLTCELTHLSYEDLKTQLMVRFGKKYLRKDFRDKKQLKDESVNEFLLDMYQLGMKVGEDEESIILVIKENLNNIFKYNLQVQLSKNFDDLKEICALIEKNLNMKIDKIKRYESSNLQ